MKLVHIKKEMRKKNKDISDLNKTLTSKKSRKVVNLHDKENEQRKKSHRSKNGSCFCFLLEKNVTHDIFLTK